MRGLIVCAILLVSGPAMARPGFYLGLGVGGAGVNGSDVPWSQILGVDGVTGTGLSTDQGGGLAAAVRLGFNILGYAALESVIHGNASDLGSESKRAWAAHWQLGGRIYPMWHWQDRLPHYLQPLEPSVYWGWGLGYQSYFPPGSFSEVGWRRIGSWRLGTSLEYYIIENVRVQLDYEYLNTPYDVFLFNFQEGITRDMNAPAPTAIHQFYFTIAFVGDPFDQLERLGRSSPATLTTKPSARLPSNVTETPEAKDPEAVDPSFPEEVEASSADEGTETPEDLAEPVEEPSEDEGEIIDI